MKVSIRLVSIGGDVDASPKEREIATGTSVADITETLGLSSEETYAVLVNDLPVAPDDRSDRMLEDGDRVTVFPPIKGG